MRRVTKILTRCSMLQILLLLVLSASGNAQMMQAISNDVHHSSGAVTWTLQQVPRSNFTCTSTTGATLACTVSGITAITSGNTLLMMSSLFTGSTVSAVFSAASGDSTWTHCPSQAGQVANKVFFTDCAEVLSATGGGTSVTFTWAGLTGSGFNAVDVVFFEIHRSTGTASIDTCGGGGATACTAVSNTTCTTCTGPTPTITGTDFVAQWISADPACTAVSSPYNSSPTPLFDSSNVEGGFAASLSQTSGAAATWTCSSASEASMSAIAFK